MLYWHFLLLQKKEIIVPPGTVSFGERLFVDKLEVTNSDWLQYMFWVENEYGKGTKKYMATVPTMIQNKANKNKSLHQQYLKHPSYEKCPVVGISYQQALDYCKWRSDRVNELFYMKEHGIGYDVVRDVCYDNIPKLVKYRLPSKSEWIAIAELGYDQKTLSKIEKKQLEKKDLYNFNAPVISNAPNNILTVPCESYLPNSIGIFDMFGNVAEMINVEGCAMGGSWRNKEISISKIYKYSESNDWVGFRCVCESEM